MRIGWLVVFVVIDDYYLNDSWLLYTYLGALDDLRKVTEYTYGMITQYGMNEKLGNIHFNLSDNPYAKPYSEETGLMIDVEVSFEFVETHWSKITLARTKP